MHSSRSSSSARRQALGFAGRALAVIGVLALGLIARHPIDVGANEAAAAGTSPRPLPVAASVQAAAHYAEAPLHFVPNAGQTDQRVHYMAQTRGASFYFTPDEAVLALSEDSGEQPKGVVLRLGFVGANSAPAVEGEAPTPTRVNYFVGSDPARWQTDLPTYGGVVYRDLWPGIDLAFSAAGGTLKYEFRVAPGANVDDIRLTYRGAEHLSLGPNGDLAIHTPSGIFRDALPEAYQSRNGGRAPVGGGYILGSDASYGFELRRTYDASQPLVLDPGLEYSTFLGGSDSEDGFAIAVDPGGHAYIAGSTFSTDFPTTTGAFDTTFHASRLAFVTKLSRDGGTTLYSTYFGGASLTSGDAIAVDASGHAYITGAAGTPDFPTTAFDTVGSALADVFVTKLSRDGSELVYSTFLGGTAFEGGSEIAVDAAGHAYVTGETVSDDFPTTPDAFDTSFNGGSDAFVTKFNRAGSALLFSTFIGGGGGEGGTGVAVDAAGRAYVAGNTSSSDFPTTSGAFDTTLAPPQDAFVAKLTRDGSRLDYSTFLGGSSDAFLPDFAAAVAVDAAGRAYVAGWTTSADFPTTFGALCTSFGGAQDAFVAKLERDGLALVYSTFLGGSEDERAWALAVDPAGRAYVTGWTRSDDFPVTPDAFATTPVSADTEVFVTKLRADGSAAAYSTFIGGTSIDAAFGIAVQPNGLAYITGTTHSDDFPTTPGLFDSTLGTADAFVIKLDTRGRRAPP